MGKIKIKGKNQARFLKEVTFEQDYEALVGFFCRRRQGNEKQEK